MQKYLNVNRAVVFLFSFLLVTGTAQTAFSHGGGHKHEKPFDITLPDVVAKVNDTDISKDPIEKGLTTLVNASAAKGKKLSIDQQKSVARKLIDAEITRTLLLQKAEELGVKVSPEQAKKSRKSVRDLTADTVLEQEIGSKIKIDDAQMKEYYEKNKAMFTGKEKARASIILIKTDKSKGADGEIAARDKIQKLADKIKSGADFSMVAKESSQDSLAKKGGDLGLFSKDTRMPAEFKKRAFSMEPGSVSDIFKTRHGFHLMKVTEKKPGGLSPFENEKDRIEKTLRHMEIKKRMPGYVQALRKNADVKTYF